MKPGVYDIAAVAYYADELDEHITLNGTVLKAFLNDSPLHAWTIHPRLNPDYAKKAAAKFDVGTAAHALFLQGELISDEEITFQVDDEAVRSATEIRVDSKPFALTVDCADWRTNIAKDVRSEARRRGLVPLLVSQWQETEALATAIRRQLPDFDTDGLAPLFVAGKAEQTLVWKDRGVWCRARLDWLHDSLEAADDLKTAAQTANPKVWTRRTMFTIGADLQAAFTLRGLRAALGVRSNFRFVIAETDAPYAISAVTLGERALELANARIDVGLDRWKRCLEEKRWPAYPLHVLTADPPSWAELDWAESQALEHEVAAA